MNSKKAKMIRRFAAVAGMGKKNEYVVPPMQEKYHLVGKDLRPQWYLITGTIRYIKDCPRNLYKRMKRSYKDLHQLQGA